MIYHTTGAHENFIERNKLDYKQNLTKTFDNVDKNIFKNDKLLHRNLLPQLAMDNQHQNYNSENNVSFFRVW